MIREDYVSFETAKLLKEKGFDAYCHSYYYPYYEDDTMKKKNYGRYRGTVNIKNKLYYEVYDRKGLMKDHYLCPTIQMAMKWLRDVHDLIISVSFTVHGWLCDITKVFRDSNGFIVNINHGIGDDSLPYCDEHEEACEAAIKYCLENLI